MVWVGVSKGEVEFKGIQEQVLKEYFDGCGRVVVSAGAGTGKTTLLVEILTESILRLYKEDPKINPFEKILAVTFTIEATRQIKSKIRKRLEKEIIDETDFKNLIRWLENESWILTLDSLTRTLLSEVSMDAGLSSITVVPDEYELNKVREDIINKIILDPNNFENIDILNRAFPNEEWKRGNRGWITVIQEAFEKSRMYCLSSKEFQANCISTFEEKLYLRFQPPFDERIVSSIFSNIRESSIVVSPNRVETSYNYNKSLLIAFCSILREYERLYDDISMRNGMMGHDDARYWIVRYSTNKTKDSKYNMEWLNAQKNRFLHILVDEFQDTSYAQCELIKHLIGENTNVFVIGDPKQAIYQWRSAEPEIFIQIINEIPDNDLSGKIPFLEASNFRKYELENNYRSHSSLIKMFNDVFGEESESIFNDSFYTGNVCLPHRNLIANAEIPSGHADESHVHVYGGECTETIPEILSAIKSSQYNVHVRDTNSEGKTIWRGAELGDCCILMQSRTKWPELRRNLIRNNINYAMIAEKGLFERPEISLIIDVLDWFSNPHNKDSLIRILRSPIVGLNDRSLRYLASLDFNLNKALRGENRPSFFDKESKVLIEDLINLRDDMRWLREGRKTRMVEEIIKFSHFDITLLTHSEGDQCSANIYALLDIISFWEEEELISYNELIERLKYYREYGTDAYNMAALADEKDRKSVKIATAHATKGLEFPIVFILHPQLDMVAQWRFFNSDKNLFLKDQGKTICMRQISPPREDSGEWESFFYTEHGLDGPCSRANPRFFDYFNIQAFSEKWRLCYVALTRAKDHIFINNHSTRNARFCWQYILNNWINNQDLNNISIVPTSFDAYISQETKEGSDFDIKIFEILKNKGTFFVPRVINPSHVYDLIFCPRRYQYAVLQRVHSGESCVFSHSKNLFKEIIFGLRVHEGLELRDFSNISLNTQYSEFIKSIERTDKNSAKEVEKTINSFIRSDIFKKYKLEEKRMKKEIEILHMIKNESNSCNVIMKDKIDLLIENGSDVIVVDYKTSYPVGTSIEDEYVKKHYEYQIQSYALALNRGYNYDVSKGIIFYFNGSSWNERIIPIDIDKIEKEIIDNIEIKIEDGGLERRGSLEFCQNFCEFRNLCKENK